MDRQATQPDSQEAQALVSIVTVVKDNREGLAETLHSFSRLASLDKLEVIIIDGLSTDGTLEVIEQNSELITAWSSEDDSGVYDAMNKGILRANGKYVILINSDEKVLPAAFDSVIKGLAQESADIVACDANLTRNGRYVFTRHARQLDWSLFANVNPFYHNAAFVSKRWYCDTGLYRTDLKIVSDLDFYYRSYFRGARMKVINESVVEADLDGLSGTQRDVLEYEFVTIINDYLPFLDRENCAQLTAIKNRLAGGDREYDPRRVGQMVATASDMGFDLARTVKLAIDENPQLFMRAGFTELLECLPRQPRFRSEAQPYETTVRSEWPPLVTIGITAFNCAETIERAIDSALDQTWPNIEVVVVDDGSTDGTREILEQYRARGVRVYFNARNYGVASTRNALVARARGEYVMFCDDDDVSHRSRAEACLERVRIAAEKLDTTPDRVVCFATRKIVEKDGSEVIVEAAGADMPLVGEDIDKVISAHLARVAGLQGRIGALDVRKPHAVGAGVGFYPISLLREVGFHETFHRLEDLEFCLAARGLQRPAVITGSKEVLYTQYTTHAADKRPDSTFKYSVLLLSMYRERLESAEIPVSDVISGYLGKSGCETQAILKQLVGDDLKSWQAPEPFRHGAPASRILPRVNDQGTALNPHSSSTAASIGREPEQQLATGLKVGIFTTYAFGGAGIGSLRRLEALNAAGVDATLYPIGARESTPRVKPLVPPVELQSVRTQIYTEVIEPARQVDGYCASELFSLARSVVSLSEYEELIDACDVLHLHWVVGMLDYHHLSTALVEKPITWTLADMNPFTGGCHFSEGCEKYKKECRNCPLLGGHSNLAHQQWLVKRRAYDKLKNLHIICPSQWMADRVRESSLLGGRPVHYIPNAFPVDRFTPINQVVARTRLGLPLNKKLLLFGAQNAANKRKGGDLLVAALKLLATRVKPADIALVLFGEGDLDVPFERHVMGTVNDEEVLAMIYSASDVFLLPSREDNAPLTVGEALLCGTPVVATPVGNVSDLVVQGETGFVCEDFTAESFLEGILFLLKTLDNSSTVALEAKVRRLAYENHEPRRSAAKHIDLYRSILGESYLR